MIYTKHTPGPWYIDEQLTAGGAPEIKSDNCWRGRQREVAQVRFAFGSEDPEVSANARLIAAAPDLLEALRDMVSDRHSLNHATVQFARAAIAKATGE